MRLLPIAFLALVLLSASTAFAMGKPRDADPVGSRAEAHAIRNLFGSEPSAVDPAKHTFVIYLNGDSDHFDADSSASQGPLEREDKYEDLQIQQIGATCADCNILLLHAQRGGAHWYTSKGPWATWIRAYSRGKKLFEHDTDNINMADPLVMTDLLEMAAHLFPNTHLHLIYRGHPFIPEYDPATAAAQGIAAFDYSDPGTKYGLPEFQESLEDASHDGVALASVTLAACRMSYLEVAASLEGLSEYLVASQLEFLETLDMGVDYSLFNQVTDTMADSDVAKLLAEKILDREDSVSTLTDAMMEEPTSLIELKGMGAIQEQLQNLIAKSGIAAGANDPALALASLVYKGLSQRYVDSLKSEEKSSDEVAMMEKFVQLLSPDGQDRDAIDFLKALSQDSRASVDTRQGADALASAIAAHVTLFNAGPATKNTGLSFQAPLQAKP